MDTSLTEVAKRAWSPDYQDALPDTAFLFVEPGTVVAGKTTPRSLRHFPVYDAQGQLDLPQLRKAMTAIARSPADWISGADKERLTARAQKMLVAAAKSTHQRAVGLQEWAMDYVAHVDEHEALGVTGDAIGKAWRGDVMIGKRASELLRSLVLKPRDRVSKRITKAIEKLLRVKVAVHNASTPPPKFRARPGVLKTAYQRGVLAYMKATRPCVKSAPQWGFARVEALLSYCKTGALPHPAYTADLDILPRAKVRKDDGLEADDDSMEVEDELSAEQAEHRTFASLPVVIDRPKGFVQRKYDDAGNLLWERTYTTDYGYIPSTLGGDEEELDVFLGPDEGAPSAFWIVQTDEEGDFDEYKVMLGCPDEDTARAIYLAHVPEKFLGRVFETPVGVMHALLGLEPGDLLKAVEPGYHFLAGPDGVLYTAHPWASLGMGTAAGADQEEDDAPSRMPAQPLRLSAEAHGEMAAAVAAVKALLPVGAVKFATPLAAGGTAGDKDAVALFSPPDPFVADMEEVAAAALGATAAIVELPDTPRNVATLAKLGSVFRLDGVPGRVFVATYPLPVSAAAVVDPIDEDAALWKAADPAEIDEVFAKYHDTVNMSASELDAWSKTECSKLASLDRRPIARNLKLLRTEKAQWGASEVAQANKTIAFVARMKNMEQGEPAREGCESKRDISLKNWAYDPGKKSAAAPAAEVGKAGTYLQIGKADGVEEHYTLGIVLVPDEPDLQGDTYDAPTIRRAADIFMSDYQNTGLQHNVKPAAIEAFRDEHPELYNGKILIVDSFVIPAEMGDVTINGRVVKAGTWLMGHRWIDAALWADVKAKKYTGLSMGGFARRIALDGAPANDTAPPAAAA